MGRRSLRRRRQSGRIGTARPDRARQVTGNRRVAGTAAAGCRARVPTRPTRGARRLLLQLFRRPARGQPQRLGGRPPRLRLGIPVRIGSLTTTSTAAALWAAVTGVVTLLPPAP